MRISPPPVKGIIQLPTQDNFFGRSFQFPGSEIWRWNNDEIQKKGGLYMNRKWIKKFASVF
jgi:hypothetical protein